MTDKIKELQETFGDKMKALKRFTCPSPPRTGALSYEC